MRRIIPFDRLMEILGHNKRIKFDYETYERLLYDGKFEALYQSTDDRSDTRIFSLIQILSDNHKASIRTFFYRAVVKGIIENNQEGYNAVVRDIGRLRDLEIIPYDWITDNTRYRTGGSSYYETTAEEALESALHVTGFYSRDFWLDQKAHIEILVEKDAMVGVLQPITRQYDVALSVLRGQASDTFIYEVAREWNSLVKRWKEPKTIYAYYLGDHDPSGFSIESSFQARIKEHLKDQKVDFEWERLAITSEDFKNPRYLPLRIKGGDKLGPDYIAKYGDKAVEVDAIPPREIRERVGKAIKQHINQEQKKATQDKVRIGQARLDMALEGVPELLKDITLPSEDEAKKWLAGKWEGGYEEDEDETS
jgi:hypothetical protein